MYVVINKWTEEELSVLRDFIKENPTVKLTTTALPLALKGRFPKRTVESVYHCWRRVMGYKRKTTKIEKIFKPVVSTPASIQGGILRAMADAAAAYMRQQIDSQCSPEIGRLKKENEELRGKLKALTELRAAAERYGKAYARGVVE